MEGKFLQIGLFLRQADTRTYCSVLDLKFKMFKLFRLNSFYSV